MRRYKTAVKVILYQRPQVPINFLLKITILLRYAKASIYLWMTNGCEITNQHTEVPQEHQNIKNGIWRQQKVIDLSWPRKGHNVIENHGCHFATYIYQRARHQQKCRSSYIHDIHSYMYINGVELCQRQALKRYGSQISLDIGNQVTGQRSW